MCLWIEEFAKTCGMGVGDVRRCIYRCMWIEEFAKTCGMCVGDEGGVYICVCGYKSSLRPVGWV